jgi:hypothetical protein
LGSGRHMNLCWDSCVFYCYLTGSPAHYYTDIAEYIMDAKAGKYKIHCSTLAFAEIRQSALAKKGYGSVQEFFADFESAFFPIDPNPNIMIAAGELKNAQPINPSDDKTPNHRVIGTADAIHLMTCLYLRDAMGVKDVIFHTLDEGKGKTWEGKCVPLLGFERWFPPDARNGRVLDVCNLNRKKPLHPQPKLPGTLPNVTSTHAQQSD